MIDMANAAGSFMQGVGSMAQAASPVITNVAPPLLRGGLQAASLGGRAGMYVTGQAMRGAHSALHNLMMMGMPMRERAELFRPGVNMIEGVGNFVHTHRI